MKSRKAMPNEGNNLLPMDIIKIFMNKNGTWEWFVYKIEESGRLYAIVFSPYTPNGEIGSVFQKELDDIGVLELELTKSIPPTGFHWEDQTLKIVEITEDSKIKSKNMNMGEFHNFLSNQLGED